MPVFIVRRCLSLSLSSSQNCAFAVVIAKGSFDPLKGSIGLLSTLFPNAVPDKAR